MPFWKLFYHLVWATKDRAPLIDDAVASAVERSVRATCEASGVRLFAFGAMPDHVHLVVSIPPSLAISDVVGRLKGASSYAAKAPDGRSRGARFAWQGEYGVFSVSEKALPDIISYACNQPARHRANTVWPSLERITEPS